MNDDANTDRTAQPSGDLPRPLRTGPRPQRHSLIPPWAYGAAAAILAVAVIGIGSALALNRSVTRLVPDVTGLDAGVARTQLRRSGFEFAVGDRRFSNEKADLVLEQDPPAGAVVRRGSTVTVIVSAGTEEFALPDVIGDGIILARGTLEDRGLEVKVNAEASDRPKDTVLATNPSPGATVHTGDIVLVTVAATSTIEGAIVPYRFPGKVFVLDPSKPAGAKAPDAPLDVTRRLRSLLEASGATVLVTRNLSDRDVSIGARAKRAAEASATAIVGLDLALTGKGGFSVLTPSGVQALRQLPTETLARALREALTLPGAVAAGGTQATDTLVASTSAPVVRVTLGSLTDREDAASFKDPTWADELARMIYRALGKTYGTR